MTKQSKYGNVKSRQIVKRNGIVKEQIAFKNGWKMLNTIDYPASNCEAHKRIASVIRDYMFRIKFHNISELETILMDQYEEELFITRSGELSNLKIKWGVISKQQKPPYYERKSVSIYAGTFLIISVLEPSSFKNIGIRSCE